MSAIPVHIRWMIRRDMPEVLDIDYASYQEPWWEKEFLHVLRHRNCIGMVAEKGEKVFGFMIYELHKDKLEVLRLAVLPCVRRRGIGAWMAEKLKSKLSSHTRRRKIIFDVPEEMLPAQLFLARQGFRGRVSKDEGYYRFVYRLQVPVEAESPLTNGPRVS